MDVLLTILIGFALIPGSLLFVVVLAWKVANRCFGFVPPHLTGVGSVLDTASWHRLARAGHPVRYALFVRLPEWLAGLWRSARGLWRRFRAFFRTPTVREVILADAFQHFCIWVEDNKARVFKDLAVEDGEEGPVARYNTRMAEVRSLYDWWTTTRPDIIVAISRRPDDVQEFHLADLELEDEHNFSRLANLWRDLT